ncbi:hypothetical protein DFR58_104214 [Anaerobacterium chartisolvens]|uniref:Uncharacterized protein n=1 Tax=Anaerobacterium chartisolvens TaxID=1297424 RepID=A0A369BBN2_9FIRM|nr:hypothetical protein [Anaerobacterium chartisolvens]RCX18939.1 hypothetical protein DFR58_104214 [Anaerobacterium chartisolvens]
MSCGKSEALHFINILHALSEKEHLFSLIAYRAAPTIWGGKPASLVTFTKGHKNPYDLWSVYKLEICKKLRLEFIEIKDTGKSIREKAYGCFFIEGELF